MAGKYDDFLDAPDAPIRGKYDDFLDAPDDAPMAAPKTMREDTRIGRTIIDQAMQGATFGFSDEITDPLGVAIAAMAENPLGFAKSVLTGKTPEVSAELNQEIMGARDRSQERLRQQFEQRPITSIAANIAGGLLTGGAAGSTKAGAAIGSSLRGGGTASRIAKGALAGAAASGLYGAGASKEGQRLEGAAKSAAIGALVGGAIPATGALAGSIKSGASNIYKGATSRSVEQLDDTISSMRQSVNQSYKVMRDSGATINRPRAINIANKVQNAISSSGKLNKSLHGNTLSVLDDFKTAVRKNDITIEELDQYRQLFRDVIDSGTDITGKMNPDAFKASKAIEAIDDAVQSLKKIDIKGGDLSGIEALNIARAGYAQVRRVETIADIIKKADNDPYVIKRELNKLLNSPKKTRGWNTQELDALKQAARQTTGEGIMKALGKFGFDLGGGRSIGNTALPAIGGLGGLGLSGGAAAIAIPTIGTGARMTQKALARGKAENVLNTLITRQGAAATTTKAISPLLSAPSGLATGVIQSTEQNPARSLPSTQNYRLNQGGQNETIAPNPVRNVPFQINQGEEPMTTPQLESTIRKAEGERLAVYRDTVGKRTIGVGFNMDSPNARRVWRSAGVQTDFDAALNGKARITKAEQDALLRVTMETAEKDARKLVPNFDKHPPNVQDALVEMSFQLGKPTLSQFKRTLNAIKKGEYELAARFLKQSKYATQTPSRVRRIAQTLTA